MTTVVEPPSRPAPRIEQRGQMALCVSAYDRVSGWLLALLVVVGTGVLILLAVWLTSRVLARTESVPIVLLDVGGGVEDGVIGESMQLDSPNPEEIPQDSDMMELEERLEAITDAISLKQAQLDDPYLGEERPRTGRSTGTGNRLGRGFGSGEPGIPRGERWQLTYQEGATLDTYAEQLDFFKIELAVLGSTSQVAYVSGFAKSKADVRTAAGGGQETRLRFAHRPGSSREAADRELLQKAGVNTEGKAVLQFISPETENQLAILEQQFAGRDASEIRKTVFGVKKTPGGYAFYVVHQSYL